MNARPTSNISLIAARQTSLFHRVFALGKGKKWRFMHSGFGWQKPCYLLGEGYATSFKELLETTDWDAHGSGRYEKCANCMAHRSYEPTAAHAAPSNPISAMLTAIRGVRTEGLMAPEISLDGQRPAQFVFSSHVERMLAEIQQKNKGAARRSQSNTSSVAQ